MDQIINILLLVIIFVFDPLAIALVVAANFAFEQLKSPKEKPNKELKQAFKRHNEEVEEWDEMHAHDMVLNDMVKQVEEDPGEKIPEVKIVEKIVEVPVEVEKNVYGEEIEEKLKVLNHPRIQKAIKFAKRAGEL